MASSFDEWYMEVERLAGVGGWSRELKTIPVAELRTCFAHGDTASAFVRGLAPPELRAELENCSGFQAWVEDVNRHLKVTSTGVSTDRLRRARLYEGYERGIAPSVFAARIRPATDFLRPEGIRSSAVPWSAWLSEVELLTKSRGIPIASYDHADLYRAYEENYTPHEFTAKNPRQRPTLTEAQWAKELHAILKNNAHGPHPDTIDPRSMYKAYASGMSPQEFSTRIDLWNAQSPPTEYANWLEELKRLIVASRPDILTSELDPNGCYALWRQGYGIAQVVGGRLPLKGDPVSQPAYSFGQASRNQEPLLVGRFSWGAFGLTWLWGCFHGQYWMLIILPISVVPVFGWAAHLVFAIWVGTQGYRLAWQSGRFRSSEDMESTERVWNVFGVLWFLATFIVGFAIGFAMTRR